MIDREKVITGLRYCSDPHTTVCSECPYLDEFMGCSVLIRETLELLKEQETEIRQLSLALDIAKGTCKGIVTTGW